MDCFLAASREEGYNYSLREAALCKPILIATNIPPHSMNAIPYCLFYNPEDVDGLVEQLKIAMAITESKRQNIKQEQREYVLKKCGLDTWLQKVTVYFK